MLEDVTGQLQQKLFGKRIKQMQRFDSETRSRYGGTAAYREHEQKTKNYTKEKWAEANDGMMAIFAEFASCNNSGASADSIEVHFSELDYHMNAHISHCQFYILLLITMQLRGYILLRPYLKNTECRLHLLPC